MTSNNSEQTRTNQSQLEETIGPCPREPLDLTDLLPVHSGLNNGDRVGPFQIMHLLGEGGFGTVYLAQQLEPVRREVALKIIKPGMDSREVISRFQAERQALAIMDHDGITRVLQTGETKDGRPWFAMEYVRGLPIHEYCDKRRLSLKERLELFSRVCDAVQHAHHRGVIHRDLKPSNILVTTDEDDQPVPKVIDFGIAKALHAPLTRNSFVTSIGQFVGTPEYMSPEQASGTALGIDTRSDVYSLGVVLYELIAGKLPFERETGSAQDYSKLLTAIQEDEPPRPSSLLSKASTKSVDFIASLRNIRSSALITTLRRDLDWIPLMAIRKSRRDRYVSAESLGNDVRRWLSGLPLEAGPQRLSYRIRLFMQRRRAAIAASLILMIGVTGTGALAWEARDAGVEAHLKAIEASRLTAFIEDSIEDMDRKNLRRSLKDALCHGHSVNGLNKDDECSSDVSAPEVSTAVHRYLSMDLMGSTLDKIRKHMSDQPLLRARLQLKTIQRAKELLLISDMPEEFSGDVISDMESAVMIFESHLGERHVKTMDSYRLAGTVFLKLEQPEKSEQYLKKTLPLHESIMGESHEHTTAIIHMIAKACGNQGRYDESESYLELLIERSTDMVASMGLGTKLLAQCDLAHVQSLRGNHHQARESLQKILEDQIDLHGPDSVMVQVTKGNLAHKLWLTGDHDEALSLAQSALDTLRMLVGDTHRHSRNIREIRDSILNEEINTPGDHDQKIPTRPQVCPMS